MDSQEVYDNYLRSVNAPDVVLRQEMLRECVTEDFEIRSPGYVVRGIDNAAERIEELMAIDGGRLTIRRISNVLAHHDTLLAKWQVVLPGGRGFGPSGYHFGDLEDCRLRRLCVFIDSSIDA